MYVPTYLGRVATLDLDLRILGLPIRIGKAKLVFATGCSVPVPVGTSRYLHTFFIVHTVSTYVWLKLLDPAQWNNSQGSISDFKYPVQPVPETVSHGADDNAYFGRAF